MKKILVINGPNLNLLGKREPHIYGRHTLDEIIAHTEAKLAGRQISVEWFQSNGEGDILLKLQEVARTASEQGVVLNPGALSHSSFALYDCLRAISHNVVEVHLSNTHGREFFPERSSVCQELPRSY